MLLRAVQRLMGTADALKREGVTLTSIESPSVSASVEGRLTRDEYARWFMDDFKNSDLSRLEVDFSEILERKIEREWELIRQSDFLLENFFNLPHVIQKAIESFSSDECALDHIETFTRLSRKVLEVEVGFDFGGIAHWELNAHFTRYLRMKHSASELIDLESVIHSLVMFYNSTGNYILVENVTLLLAILRGLDFMVSTLERWTAREAPGSFSDFTKVVENWEKDFEVLPIEWIANIVRCESVE